jgi:HipA-like protein
MQAVDGRRVLAAERRGSSWPVLVDTDAGVLFTKLHGAAQGPGALVAEVIAAELAEALGMRVPARTLVRFGDRIESADPNDELADLLRASAGLNLGFRYLDDAAPFAPDTDVDRVAPHDAAAILWLDALTQNPDRSARNPNLLWWQDALWLIDHGAALAFQYALPDMDSSAPRRPYTLREPHILQARVDSLARYDEELARQLTHEIVEAAVAAVPDEFLAPLIRGAPANATSLRDRRSAYVEYLGRRLEAPRPFLEPVITPPNEQPRRGRPAWLARGR